MGFVENVKREITWFRMAS